MRKLKQCLCYLHVKCLGSVLGLSQIMNALFSEVITFDFLVMLCSTLINHSAWLSAENKNLSASQCPSCSLLYLLLQDAPKTKSVSHRLYNPQDSMSALKVHLHLNMGNSCMVWGFCEMFHCNLSSHFEHRLFTTK